MAGFRTVFKKQPVKKLCQKVTYKKPVMGSSWKTESKADICKQYFQKEK